MATHRMNRKAQAKKDKKEAGVKKLHFSSAFDDPIAWLQGIPSTPPWPKDKIKDFQKRIDSAFGAENAIVLVWSGDRSYGDEFYTDWFSNGQPKGKPERKPVLLFSEHKVNDHDYVYVTCPRWLLMEVNHGSQLEAGWEGSSWVSDSSFTGGKKRIRPEKPPEYFYTHLEILAEHEKPILTNDIPPCCLRMLREKRICYGKYREPDDRDIATVGEIRARMDRDGVAQRNDSARSEKLLRKASAQTRYFIKRAEQQKAKGAMDLVLAHPEKFFRDIVLRKGGSMSARELERTVKGALEQQEQERFA